MAQNLSKLNDLPSRESGREARERRGYRRKDFPYRHLKGFLKANIGRLWDAIVSEWMHAEWVPARHRRVSEIERYVETVTEIREGTIYAHLARYWFSKWAHETNVLELSDAYYIHPTTRILCYQPKKTCENWRKRMEAEKFARCRIIAPFHQIAKQDGIWYEVKANEKLCRQEKIAGDHEFLSYSGYLSFLTIINLKKQLNHKELKKYGVTNG